MTSLSDQKTMGLFFFLHLGKIRKLAVHWEMEGLPADVIGAIRCLTCNISISVPIIVP